MPGTGASHVPGAGVTTPRTAEAAMPKALPARADWLAGYCPYVWSRGATLPVAAWRSMGMGRRHGWLAHPVLRQGRRTGPGLYSLSRRPRMRAVPG